MTAIMPIAVLSARELGWQDGDAARAAFANDGTIIRPNERGHGITSGTARIQYQQGWIRGRLGTPIEDRCPVCHVRHPDGQHLPGLVA